MKNFTKHSDALPKLCKRNKDYDDNDEAEAKEDKTTHLNGYDKVRSQVENSDNYNQKNNINLAARRIR